MSTRGHDDAPRPIGEALAAVARGLGLGDPARAGAAIERWPEVVGPALAVHSKARGLRDGTLTVVVDAPAWATQIVALEARILERLASAVGDGACRALRVRVDPEAFGGR